LHALFVKMQHQIKFRGVHVGVSYMDFDTHNNDRVSSSQFLRNMPFQNMSPHDIQLLLQRYMDPTVRHVNYWQLHHDLQRFSATPPGGVAMPDLTLPHHAQSIKLNPLPSNPADVIERFSAYVCCNRVRILDFFVFHDRLKSGRITSDQFMNVLTLFGFQFSGDELGDLAARYGVVDGYTRYAKYREFCSDVDSASRAAASGDRTADPSAQAAIDGIRSHISRNRIHVLPPFQDFNRSRRGYVSELQFGRVLAAMKIPVQRSDVPLLLGAYRRPGGIDYFQFVEDVDPAHGEQRRSCRPMGTTRQSIQEVYGHTPSGDEFVSQETADALIHESKRRLLPKLHQKRDADELIRDIQRWCYSHSVHFHDFLREFDRLNSGDVSATQFRAGLLRAGYRLTDNEH
jgi:Ca2+-binding EF-hand superfamily protein